SLSFIKSFPQAHVSVSDLVITNLEPFKDETFMEVKNSSFTMSIKELFKDFEKEPLVVNAITIDGALLNLKTDKDGNTNYDITKESDTAPAQKDGKAMTFDIQDYKISNSAVTYWDEASKIDMKITDLSHEGRGTFSTEESDVDTKTEARVTCSMESTNY